ncbi:bifunctional DNA primase/polymerase [Deinococcus multiflagellatus]|uniref:Bifunctional DNA primase/polymerase n=1 Tax=Deinococcus multiflagellatus TaxID=1656887 RepID=A0ABW1ZV55_9DEIO
MTLLDAGLAALDHGWSLCPIQAGNPHRPASDKDPHMEALSRTGYTDPHTRKVVWRPLQHTPPSEAVLRAWLKCPYVGLALVTGERSGVVTLDFDGEAGQQLVGTLGLTPHTRTPSGGFHLRVPHPGWRVSTLASKNTAKLPPGLDIRGDGGLAVLPPTTSCKGTYEALRDPFDLIDARQLPLALREAAGLTAPVVRVAPAVPVTVPPADRFPADRILFLALTKLGEGEGRNNTGYWLARALHNNFYVEDEILAIGRSFVDQTGETNAKGQREPYTYAEFQASTKQALRLEREPWLPTRDKTTRPQRVKVTDELQEAWPSLDWSQRARRRAAGPDVGPKGATGKDHDLFALVRRRERRCAGRGPGGLPVPWRAPQ